MWSSFSRTVFPNLRNMIVQQRESCAGGLVISVIQSIGLHTGRQVRRPAKVFWMLVPKFPLVLVSLNHGAGEVSTTLAIPLRPTSAGVVVGDWAGIEARHIGFEVLHSPGAVLPNLRPYFLTAHFITPLTTVRKATR